MLSIVHFTLKYISEESLLTYLNEYRGQIAIDNSICQTNEWNMKAQRSILKSSFLLLENTRIFCKLPNSWLTDGSVIFL